MKTHLRAAVAAVAASGMLALTGCASAGSGDGPEEITLWTHTAGDTGEGELVQKLIDEFNASQDDYEVVFERFPQKDYNDSVTAAAVSGDLPCIMDIDGPILPNWAWAGYLRPLAPDQEVLDRMLDGTKGYWDGELYSVGLYDAATAVMARRSVLDELGIRIPTADTPWTKDEFDAALGTLKDSGRFQYPIDLGTGWKGEWYPYAFSPFLQSFGGDLVDREDFATADGALNGAAALEWGTWWQGLFTSGYANPQESDNRDGVFVDGTVALQYNGNWAAKAAYDAFGDDLLFLPTPDLGDGPVIGAASWQWGVSSSCDQAEGAQAWIDFALQDEWFVQFSDVNGLIPATMEAAAESELYSEGSPYLPFAEYARTISLIRPDTPAYPVISKVFEKAATDIMNGADVQQTLDQAVVEIDADIEANDSYR